MQIRLRLLDIMDLLIHFQESTFWNLVIFSQLKPKKSWVPISLQNNRLHFTFEQTYLKLSS